jgi:hypothetical protein
MSSYTSNGHYGSIKEWHWGVSPSVDGDKLWTRKKFVQSRKETEQPPPGVVLYDKMRSDTRKVIGGSNGSLYPDDKVMTAAWIVATDEEHFTWACVVIQQVPSLSSYRAELEGTFRFLKHIEWLGLTPEEVRHWCDNKGAVKATKLMSIPTPSDMLAPDADLIQAWILLKGAHYQHKTSIQYVICWCEFVSVNSCYAPLETNFYPGRIIITATDWIERSVICESIWFDCFIPSLIY